MFYNVGMTRKLHDLGQTYPVMKSNTRVGCRYWLLEIVIKQPELFKIVTLYSNILLLFNSHGKSSILLDSMDFWGGFT